MLWFLLQAEPITDLTFLDEILVPQAQEATLLFAGDAMQHEKQLVAARQPDGSYDFSNYYANIDSTIAAADYAVVNLETPLGGAPYSGYPLFCAPDTFAASLRHSGFDLFLLANNHALDRRDNGLIRTVNTLSDMGIPSIGGYRSKADRHKRMPYITEVKGFKIAFLNYTYGTNGIPLQGKAYVDLIDRNAIATDVHSARSRGAELVCVCIHWGDEYHLLPNATQRSLARFMQNLGVDMIIGSHPHVIQPMELLTDSTTQRSTVVCYSLGNFISAMKDRDCRGGAMLEVKLSRRPDGTAYVADAGYHLVFTVPHTYSGIGYFLIDAHRQLSGELETARQAFVNKATEIFDKYNVRVGECRRPTDSQ